MSCGISLDTGRRPGRERHRQNSPKALVCQVFAAIQQLREHNPEDAKCRGELAASLLAATGSAHLNSQLTLSREQTSGNLGLR